MHPVTRRSDNSVAIAIAFFVSIVGFVAIVGRSVEPMELGRLVVGQRGR
jgi:hypothetical protein